MKEKRETTPGLHTSVPFWPGASCGWHGSCSPRRAGMNTHTSPHSASYISQEEFAAYHEAGHAVAFSLIGRELVQVFLGPDPGNGGCELTPVGTALDLHDPRAQVFAEKHIVAHLAGPVVEALLLGREEDCLGLTFSASDLREARLISEKLAQVRAARKAEHTSDLLFWSKWTATAELLRDPPRWAAVEALARALLVRQSIEGPHAQRIIAEALGGHSEKPQGAEPPATTCTSAGPWTLADHSRHCFCHYAQSRARSHPSSS